VNHLHFGQVIPFLGDLPRAIWISVSLSLLAIAIGLPVGLAGALLRRSGSRPARGLSAAYVEFVRNTPVIVLLYLVFFGLAEAGLRVSGYGSALIALTLNGSAYMVEIFRGGLAAIPRGQAEAAASLGLSRRGIFRLVVWPQLLRIVYAPLGNVFIQILLGSSLASVVSVPEVTDWMENAGSQSFRFFETFAIAGIVYVVLCQAVNVGRWVLGRLLFRAA
jgi:His/Glu/Gln/Arg/opine family amino acid ABC transporter permease subunit